MSRQPDYEKMTVAEQIRAGLQDAIAHARGELSLKTTTLIAPAPRLSGRRVASIRKRTGMSQAVFASYLNVPTKTLQSWEQGARIPKAGEARLLQIAEADPSGFVELIISAGTPPGRSKKTPADSRRRRVA
jgi:putative transcriptional regulator